ncbi:MAG: hypothetical protein V1489_02030 [Candidatus Liptonbacteria bacterium]
MSINRMTKILVGTVVFLALIALGSWYYFFLHSGAASTMLALNLPDEVRLGEPFTASVQFTNSSEKKLAGATASLAVPDGIAIVGSDKSNRITSGSLGDLDPGAGAKLDFTLIATKDAQSTKQLTATVEYGISGNSSDRSRYTTSKTADVLIGCSAIPFTFAAPQKITAGNPFSVVVSFRNNSTKDYSNLRLKVSYPPNFQFTNSDPGPDLGNNEWRIRGFPRDSEKKFTITGTMAGAANSVADFVANLVATASGHDYPVSSETVSVSIAQSLLSVSVQPDKEDYAQLNQTLNYVITYKNNSTISLQNITISADLNGELFDIATVTSEGSLNSVANTIGWNAANVPALALVAPGSGGSVHFSVKTRSQFPIARLGDKNYSLSVKTTAESPTVPAGSSGMKTVSYGSSEMRVAGEVALKTKALYRDAAAGVVNNGPYPPRVNQTTQYTVHWIITNYATNISNTVVSASLQSGAKVVSMLSSTAAVKPVYNPSSGDITWNVGSMPATQGVISAPIEAIFQIEQTPGLNQVSRSVTLLGKTTLEADDDWTGMHFTETSPPVTTDLTDDTSITESDRRVQQ